MRMRTLAAPILAALVALPLAAHAQEQTPKPVKFQNVTWYRVVNLAIKPGHMGEVLDVFRKYYFPAASAAHVGAPMVLEDRDGQWDLTLIWTMKDGPAGMEWRRSPNSIAFGTEFRKLVGGRAKADSIVKIVQSSITRSASYIAMEESVFANAMH